jgi:hypothetical protein
MAHFRLLFIAILSVTFQPVAFAYIRFDLAELTMETDVGLPGQLPKVIEIPEYSIRKYIDSRGGEVHGYATSTFTTPLSPWGFESYASANASTYLKSPSEVTASARVTQTFRFTTDRSYIISVESFGMLWTPSFQVAGHANSRISNLSGTPEFNFEFLLNFPETQSFTGFRRNRILPAGSYEFVAIATAAASPWVNYLGANGMKAEIRSKLNLYPLPGSAPEGDYDGDGVVSGADFLKWQRDFGSAPGLEPFADGDNNGVVDAFDLEIWKAFLEPPEIPTEVWDSIYNPSPLPEPSAFVLAASALIALGIARSAQRANRRGAH